MSKIRFYPILYNVFIFSQKGFSFFFHNLTHSVNWYKITISSNPYGYWILPNGQSKPVRFEEHEIAAMNLGYLGTTDAIEKGLIRTSTGWDGTFFIEIVKPATTSQKKTIKKIIQDKSLIDDYGRLHKVQINGKTHNTIPRSLEDIDLL
jgi:hypothetical protein